MRSEIIFLKDVAPVIEKGLAMAMFLLVHF